MLTIGIVGGTGNEGRGLSLRLARAGVPVRVGSRDPERARDVAARLATSATGADLAGTSNGDAIAGSDVVILAVPFTHAAALIEAHAAAFRRGSLVIDVTVPVVFEAGRPRYVEPPEGSAAAHVRARLPASVALAATFKTLPARLLENAAAPLDCDEFVCGDSDEARQRAADVVSRIEGLRPVDAGTLDAAATLERMTVLLIGLNKRYRSHDGRFRVLGM